MISLLKVTKWIIGGLLYTMEKLLMKKYFMEKLIDAGFKLNELRVNKNILSEDEKKLLILCSTKVRCVFLYHPVKIDGWTPKHEIKKLLIIISCTFVSKNEFEGFVPWIRLAESTGRNLRTRSIVHVKTSILKTFELVL